LFEVGDSVRIKNAGAEVFTIVEIWVSGLYKAELGNDAASIRYKRESVLELVAKAKKTDSGPGFVPARPIMEP
jgi:hypothetical protein